ncbi:MAG: GspH/FimT family pseudopilin [Arenicellales bacterium]
MHPRQGAGDRERRGFSLVELLVTLAVASLLLAAGLPSFLSMVRNDRINNGIDLLLADVNLARLAAVERDRDVVLCRSRDGRHCQRSSRAHTDWSRGWIVYVNPDGDKRRDPGEPLLEARAALTEGLTLSFNQWWRVVYHGDGSARNGTFVLCDSRGPRGARALVLYYTGRPRVSARRADGDPLVCPSGSPGS